MMRRIVVMVIGLLAAIPAAGVAGTLDLRAGAFFPKADSNLFRDDSELYTVDKSDWRGFTGGAEYSFNVGDNVELGFHVDGYGRTVHTSYLDFVTESGREIQQSLKLTIVPMGVSLRFVPIRGRRALTPYATVGADLVFYSYEEFGDFVDFETSEIFEDAFISEGVAPGFHVAGGLRVPVGDDFRVTGEVRYQWAKADMGDDFRGNEIDMSGLSATVGLSLRF
jgi:hypothetical protein